MGDFTFYFELGLKHVLDWAAYDHVLFIVVMSVLYMSMKRDGKTGVQWKNLFLLVTSFTVGHTGSLLLSNYGVFSPSSKWIEFLIPVTIIATALNNILSLKKSNSNTGIRNVMFLTLLFGVIHGFGFGRYFNHINEDREILPLLAFALGIEASQLLVVITLLGLGFVFQRLFGLPYRFWVWLISGIVFLLTLPMLIENFPV